MLKRCISSKKIFGSLNGHLVRFTAWSGAIIRMKLEHKTGLRSKARLIKALKAKSNR